ncbi:MAG: SPOR domain-containing protein [Paludibacteraceae bacterium]|nr:SPOR domain-containing protein [Paludibacteraceae bacterium]MBQ2189666.1 SPOR domain-containing protein [Paludibacteraceae bacterium]MBQ2520884.1 SPOR domain-containing protein [Paludibacteraceae bacterium]
MIISLVVLASLSMWAQELKGNPLRPNLADSLTGVELIQDSTVGVLLNAVMRGKLELVELDGYRVQVYSSNQQQTAKAEALNLEEKLKDKINQTVYVQYIPPFWKVRIGDFRTYNEAKEYKNEFVELYPKLMGDTYIVRDKIQVWQ